MTHTTVGFAVHVKTNFATALERTTKSLLAEGFGILTEIDVKETMKKKLGAGFRPYKILGACNPPLAHRALTAAPEAGLLLPCNVTVSEISNDTIEISLVDPLAMLGVIPNPALQPIARDARERLERVAAALEEKTYAPV